MLVGPPKSRTLAVLAGSKGPSSFAMIAERLIYFHKMGMTLPHLLTPLDPLIRLTQKEELPIIPSSAGLAQLVERQLPNITTALNNITENTQ